MITVEYQYGRFWWWIRRRRRRFETVEAAYAWLLQSADHKWRRYKIIDADGNGIMGGGNF